VLVLLLLLLLLPVLPLRLSFFLAPHLPLHNHCRVSCNPDVVLHVQI
jgi:hypothetical protein